MADVKPYPVTVTGDLSDPPSRWQWIFKWLLLIPHYIVLYFLGIAAAVVSVIAWFAILFTGKYPKSLFDFVAGYLRWSWRVSFYGYNVLGTDKYPPFTLDKAPYPANFDVVYPEKLKNWMVLVKWLLAIPHFIILYVLSIVLEVLIVVVAIVLLFTGKYMEEIFKFVVGINRWQQRVMAYVLLLTDEYPPFGFD
jgi:Domain of unknown function (DUF4389)